jgi:hypothetical protein
VQEIKYDGLLTNKTRVTFHLLPSENELKEIPCYNHYIKESNVELENWPADYYTLKIIPLRLQVYCTENVFTDKPNIFSYIKFAL